MVRCPYCTLPLSAAGHAVAEVLGLRVITCPDMKPGEAFLVAPPSQVVRVA